MEKRAAAFAAALQAVDIGPAWNDIAHKT